LLAHRNLLDYHSISRSSDDLTNGTYYLNMPSVYNRDAASFFGAKTIDIYNNLSDERMYAGEASSRAEAAAEHTVDDVIRVA